VPRLTRAQRAAAAITVAACCGALVACASADVRTADPEPVVSASPTASEAPIWRPNAEEEAMLLECAAEKLGYAFTLEDIVDPDMSDGEGIIDTPEEWEGRRMDRAYGQCWWVNQPDLESLDMDDFGNRTRYNGAYGIIWGEDEPRDDPLAPWPGKENLGWG
jgi:hypothetical protein